MSDLLDRRQFLDVAVRRFNPAIPPSLEAIVAKCLACSPGDRYTDAESLAQDLERFLNHQPLLKAGNPSRREQMSNCWRRQRRMLTRAGFIGAVTVIFGAALAGPVIELFAPPEESPALQLAIQLFKAGEFKSAADRLREMIKKNPRAVLAKIYLAFVLEDDPDIAHEADKYLREALAVPTHEKVILAHAEKHPEFCSHLVDFIDLSIIRAEEFSQEYDVENPRDEQRRDFVLREPAFSLAKKALSLALKLDSTSPRIHRLLATTEEFFGDYLQAFDRLSDVIESIPYVKNTKNDPVFFSHKVRGRVAFLLVEDMPGQGKKFDEDSHKTLEIALSDLDFCEVYLDKYDMPDHKLKRFRVFHDQARATLTLAEVEMKLEMPNDARGHLNKVGPLIGKMNYGRSKGVRAPEPTGLSKRLKYDTTRLENLTKITRSPSDQDHSNRSQTNGACSQ